MRSWLVAGALIEGPSGLLLVSNRRHDGVVDWTTPGGVIDPGESVISGLAREVREETGLEVSRWGELAYEIEVQAPDLGWDLRVEVHRVVAVTGDLVIDDPDGIVTEACYVECELCEDRLGASQPWVKEPLVSWLTNRWSSPQAFRYRVEGSDLNSIEVTSLT